MDWLRVPAALVLVFLSSFGAAFLGSAWERRRKRNENLDGILARLPGFNCGLCGHDDCRSFAKALSEGRADPGLCAPGGRETEDRLRLSLPSSAKDKVVAFIRCGGIKSAAREIYAADGRKDCKVAASCYQGPKACTEACIGFGSCVSACPIGAIAVKDGLARVNHDLCSGCGICVEHCPTQVIALIPRSSTWQVACNSRRPPQEKAQDCARACTACGVCVQFSSSWEFSISDNLAKASVNVPNEGPRSGDWQAIAERCPTRAIVNTRSQGKKEKQAERPRSDEEKKN
jgi:Na+-translocating ferredoxin:NAD+ oxidoreductase subunit B